MSEVEDSMSYVERAMPNERMVSNAVINRYHGQIPQVG